MSDLNNSKDFSTIKPFAFWTQHVLPLVYGDEISYMETLDKVVKLLNELIKNNNKLPDYIQKIVEEYITGGPLEEVLSGILANFILNVKYPPTGITPAKGDGTANDYEAIQGCIDYAANKGGGVVYFPFGKYLTSKLTVKPGVSLMGFGKYCTNIVLTGGETGSLISGTVNDCGIYNLTLDGNMSIQVNNVDVVTLTGYNIQLMNVILTDGYTLFNIEKTGDNIEVNNVEFRYAVESMLRIGGNVGSVNADSVTFGSLSTIKGVAAIISDSDNDVITGIVSNKTLPLFAELDGNNNVLEGKVVSANLISGDGHGNVYDFYCRTKNETYSGDVGETVRGNKSVHIGGTYTRAVDNNSTESVDGTKSEVVTGVSSATYKDNRTITGTNFNETLTGKKNITAKSVNVDSEDFVIDASNGLTYGNIKKLNDTFNYVPAIDLNGNAYKILTDSGNLSKLEHTQLKAPHEIITNIIAEKVFRNDESYYIPQGADYAENGKYILSLLNGKDNTVNLICLDINTFTIYWNIIIPANHANSVVFNPNDRKIYIAACFTFENPGTLIPAIYVVDYDNPNNGIIDTITAPVDGIYSIALDKENNKWYSINYRGTELGKYNRVYVYNGIFESVEKTIDLKNYPYINGEFPSWQGITMVKDGVIYGIIYSPISALVAWDLTGNLITKATINRFSNGFKPISEIEALFYNKDTDTICIVASNLLQSENDENTHGAVILETNINKSITTYTFPFVGTSATRINAIGTDMGDKSWKPATENKLKSFYDAISLVKNSFYRNAVIYVMDSSKEGNNAVINNAVLYDVNCIIRPTDKATKVTFNGLLIGFSNITFNSAEFGGTRVDSGIKGNIAVRASNVRLNGKLLQVDNNDYGILSYQGSVVRHNTANDSLSYPIGYAVNHGVIIDNDRDGMYTNKYIKYDDTVPVQKTEVWLGGVSVGGTNTLKTKINDGYLYNKISVCLNDGIFCSAIMSTTASVMTQTFSFNTSLNGKKTIVWCTLEINVNNNTLKMTELKAISWNDTTNVFEKESIASIVLRIWLERV